MERELTKRCKTIAYNIAMVIDLWYKIKASQYKRSKKQIGKKR